MIMMLLMWIVPIACLVAVVTDVRERRIPNALTLSLAAIAIAAHATQGVVPLISSLLVLAVVLVVGTFAFSCGWLGGGDVKLGAAVAAAFGYPDVVAFLIYTSLAGGVFALCYAAAIGRLGIVLRNAALVLRPFAYEGTVPEAPSSRTAFPYATAIAAGALAVTLSHTLMPFLRLPI
jgi:prepilin peptidase CpaA